MTDGNLASHLRALEEGGYISMEKSFINRKPNTNYTITEKGLESFKSHLKALEELINKTIIFFIINTLKCKVL